MIIMISGNFSFYIKCRSFHSFFASLDHYHHHCRYTWEEYRMYIVFILVYEIYDLVVVAAAIVVGAVTDGSFLANSCFDLVSKTGKT